jgi:hypothetical protein
MQKLIMIVNRSMNKLNQYMLSYIDNKKWYQFNESNFEELFLEISHSDSLILKEVFNIDKEPTVDKTEQDDQFELHFNYIKRSLIENENTYTYIGNFDLNWNSDIQKAKALIDENKIKMLRYKDAFITDALTTDSTESTINLDVNEYLSFKEIVDRLGLINAKVRFMIQRPGCIVPTHIDNLNHNESAMRFGVALNDWEYGQFWHFGKKVWANWKKGDCIQWNKLTPHGTCNTGHSDRYTLQITGEPTEKTFSLLSL